MQVLRNAPIGIIRHGLLPKAEDIYRQRYPQLNELIFLTRRDDIGIYAYETPKHFLCAKPKPHFVKGKEIVSCHHEILECAASSHKLIAMYIHSKKDIFEFIPSDIINSEYSVNNWREGIMMTNFYLELGKPMDQIPMFTVHQTPEGPKIKSDYEGGREKIKELMGSLK